MKWTRASEDNLPRPEDMPKCGRLLGPNGIWYYGTIHMVAEIIAAARNKPLHKNKAMYTEWLDESPESSVWTGEEEKGELLKWLKIRFEGIEDQPRWDDIVDIINILNRHKI